MVLRLYSYNPLRVDTPAIIRNHGITQRPSLTKSLENDVTGDLDSIMRRRLACLYLGYIIFGFAWNWSSKLVIFLACFILTLSFLTLFAECIALSWLRDRLKVALLAVSSDVLLCLASTVWVKQQNDFGFIARRTSTWHATAAALVHARFKLHSSACIIFHHWQARHGSSWMVGG